MSLESRSNSGETLLCRDVRPRQRRLAAMLWFLVSLVYPSLSLLVAAILLNNRESVYILVAVLLYISFWFGVRESREHSGVSFSSLFILISTFVFGARALYIAVYKDFSVLQFFGLRCEWPTIIEPLCWVIVGHIAFITGGDVLRPSSTRGGGNHLRVTSSESVLRSAPYWLLIQGGITVALMVSGAGRDKNSLASISDNAYVYALPMLTHGVNLYAGTVVALAARNSRSIFKYSLLAVSASVVLSDAYLLANLTTSRSFYLIGIFAYAIALMIAFQGKVALWVVILLLAMYPSFKTLGQNRSTNSDELLVNLTEDPFGSYSQEGFRVAFDGKSTDINMLDTFAASLNWEHQYRPYALSYLYVFVHPIPRAIWPGKPKNGVLADDGYLFGIPYIGGIIACFNDDGGKVYMVFMMGLLGAFIRSWERLVQRIRDQSLRISVWAILFLTTLITVRALPFQSCVFFGIMYVPCIGCYYLNRICIAGDR